MGKGGESTTLNENSLNQNVLKAEYAVRGDGTGPPSRRRAGTGDDGPGL